MKAQQNLLRDNILLRGLERKDIDLLWQLRSDPQVLTYIKRDPPKEKADVEAFYQKIEEAVDKGISYYWVVTTHSHSPEDELLGTICLWNITADGKCGEIGYELLPVHQGKGIMSAALKMVLSFAFDILKLELVEAYTHKDNQASQKLLSRFDFILDPSIKDEYVEENIVFRKRNPGK
ncbi:GNAT family N-acetyltransferase [Chitinophaga caeni]|uniref:GNAT family N-acetyltransferase n=1 Tax=Chitinophaga caeni TaxID=2029983 RepID=A0A291QZ51_9BACT|nr:GNAT family N-acetyltransferase [Chitinophaga caeni]ATL49215.1 GNAT family N-acetyltransferase [Chitinophaga caeni]